jgi:DNA-binding NarL/FixJ family response regulator
VGQLRQSPLHEHAVVVRRRVTYTLLDMPQIRVALVEDQPRTREGLALLIGSSPGFEIAGQYGSMVDALSALERVSPDVLLADIGLPVCRASKGFAFCTANITSEQTC